MGTFLERWKLLENWSGSLLVNKVNVVVKNMPPKAIPGPCLQTFKKKTESVLDDIFQKIEKAGILPNSLCCPAVRTSHGCPGGESYRKVALVNMNVRKQQATTKPKQDLGKANNTLKRYSVTTSWGSGMQS